MTTTIKNTKPTSTKVDKTLTPKIHSPSDKQLSPDALQALINAKLDQTHGEIRTNQAFDVIFVSNTNRIERPYYDPSVRYRAFNAVNFLRRRGVRAMVITQNVFEDNHESFTNAGTIVFHRPLFSEALARYVTKYKRRQMLVCDYDDLVFDVMATNDTPAVSDRDEDPTRISRNLAANAEMGAMFDHKTASTTPLAEAVDRCLGGKSLVIHNALDQTYVDVARAIRRNKMGSKCLYDIGYFSGTASHNQDFASVAQTIANFLSVSSHRKLFVIGPVFRPIELIPFEAQITQIEVVPFYEMTSLIASCRIVLGPLVINPFAVCKSGLKFFEAASLGVRVAATPIPDIDRFESPLLYKCTTPEHWENAFLDDAALDYQLSEQAAEAVCSEVALDKQMKIWIDAFLGRD